VYMRKYNLALARKRGDLPGLTALEQLAAAELIEARANERKTLASFDPTKYEIRPPTMRRFRAWLDEHKMRFTQFKVPHPCPLCTTGPSDELVFETINAQLVALKTANQPVPSTLLQQHAYARLRTSLRGYRLHVEQLAQCRARAKYAEDHLAVGECMVIRDFVNHHDHAGGHVKCLHWVLMWRDTEGGNIKRLKLRHYCSDKKSLSTDSYYQADITDFHLNEDNEHCPLLFVPFHLIIFVGDHGPHFASHETMYNESTLKRRYGKTIKCMYLTSYHAYSRADCSGSQDSTALRRDMRMGLPRYGARAMTDMTNESNDPSSWAYEFPSINRNKDVFPLARHFEAKDRAKWIKKWCEVGYEQPAANADKRYDGILQYRLVTGVGPWVWTDLVAARR
jgi:hypothetical protein